MYKILQSTLPLRIISCIEHETVSLGYNYQKLGTECYQRILMIYELQPDNATTKHITVVGFVCKRSVIGHLEQHILASFINYLSTRTRLIYLRWLNDARELDWHSYQLNSTLKFRERLLYHRGMN